ncbi:chloride channel protein, partial [Rhizobium ruizarguesonis]
VASLRNGAYGGTLTPGLALGSACGFVLTGTLILVFPTLIQLQPGAGAFHASELLGTAGLLGAVTFLSLSMNAPLSACALIL